MGKESVEEELTRRRSLEKFADPFPSNTKGCVQATRRDFQSNIATLLPYSTFKFSTHCSSHQQRRNVSPGHHESN